MICRSMIGYLCLSVIECVIVGCIVEIEWYRKECSIYYNCIEYIEKVIWIKLLMKFKKRVGNKIC